MTKDQEIRAALSGKGIVGRDADVLTTYISTALKCVEDQGGATAIGDRIAARIAAVRKGG